MCCCLCALGFKFCRCVGAHFVGVCVCVRVCVCVCQKSVSERESDRALGEKEQAKITAESFLNWRKKGNKVSILAPGSREEREKEKKLKLEILSGFVLGNLGELLAKEELKCVSGNEDRDYQRGGESKIKLRGKKFQVNFTN